MPGLLPRALRAVGGGSSFSSSSSRSCCACSARATCPSWSSASADGGRRRPGRPRPRRHGGARRRAPAGDAARCRRRALLVARGAFAAAGRRLVAGERRATAIVAAGRLVELAALTLGAVAFLDAPRAPPRAPGRARRASPRVGRGVGPRRASSPTTGGRQASFVGRARPRRARDAGARRRARLASSPTGRARRLAARRDRRRRVGVVLGAVAREPARRLPRRRRDRRGRGCAARAPRRGRAGHGRRSPAVATAGTLALRSGELGFLRRGSARQPDDARRVRGELEPAADLRLHRRAGLPRPPGHSARAGTALLPPDEFAQYLPGRARALLRPAAALLPAGGRRLHPPADLRPGALRARARRRSRCCSRSPRSRAAGGVAGAAWPRGAGRSAAYVPLAGWRRSRARSRARRCSAARRWPRSSG